MTTPQSPDPIDFAVAVDGVGIMAKMSLSYTERALKTGEIVPTDKPGIYRLARTVPMRVLSPAERRALELKKARAHR